MSEQYWNLHGFHGLVFRTGLRTFQFIFAVITAALYGADLAGWTRTHTTAETNWIYAEVVAAFSGITCAVHCFATMTRVSWCVWDAVLFLLWLVLATLSGQLIFGETDVEVKFSMENMKAAFAMELISMSLWLMSTIEGCSFCWTRGRRRHVSKLEPEAEMLNLRA